MTEQEKVIAKIKTTAQENLNKKLEEEKRKLESRIAYDTELVERCLKYIQNKMVFKIIGDNIYSNKYVLADENTFLHDYTRKPKYEFDSGINFSDPSDKPYKPLFKVNGEKYYDMRYIIRHYEEKFTTYKERLNDLHDKFNEVEKMANELIKQEPHIKKLIEEYKQVEIDETYLENLFDDRW